MTLARISHISSRYSTYFQPRNFTTWWRHQTEAFPRYWPFVRWIHRSPVNSPHKGQWRGALIFSLICALNKLLSKQSWGWWFGTPSRSLWCHCNEIMYPCRTVSYCAVIIVIYNVTENAISVKSCVWMCLCYGVLCCAIHICHCSVPQLAISCHIMPWHAIRTSHFDPSNKLLQHARSSRWCETQIVQACSTN